MYQSISDPSLFAAFFSCWQFFHFVPNLSRSKDEEGLHGITIQIPLEHLQALEREAPGYVVRVPGRSGSLLDPDGLPLEVEVAGCWGCTDHRWSSGTHLKSVLVNKDFASTSR